MVVSGELIVHCTYMKVPSVSTADDRVRAEHGTQREAQGDQR